MLSADSRISCAVKPFLSICVCASGKAVFRLDCAGITDVIAGKIRSLVTQQLRQMVRSYSMFTHEANEDLLLRLHIEDPIGRIYKAFTHRCSKPPMEFECLQVWESHAQWLHVLRGRLFDNSEVARQSAQDVRIGSAGQSSTKARVVPVHIVTEQFVCHECGFAFATQAALKSHKYKIHFAEKDKETRQAEIHKRKQHPATEHARDGMPTCKHCGHQFESWPAFAYHVNSRSCAETRFFYSQENSRDQLATLQDALMSRDELLQAATSLKWREMAELPVVKQHHNHCLECHHWCASPMYVKRHMKSKHPELTAIVQDVTAKIVQSDLALKSPCRFCGQTFKNRRAHLSSCIGVFNGHYLIRRLGRTLVTGLQNGSSAGGSEGAGAGDQRAGHDPGPDPNFASSPASPGNVDGGAGAGPRPVHGHLGQVCHEDQTGRRRRQKQGQAGQVVETSQQRKSAGPRQRSIAEFLQVGKLVKLERPGQEQGRPGPAQTAGGYAYDLGSPTGAPVDDQSARHQLHHFYQDGCNAQLGGDVIQYWSELEAGQNFESRKPEAPLASDSFSAPDDVHDRCPGNHAVRCSESRASQDLGLDSRGPFHRSEVECGEEDARGGHQDSPHPDSANPEPHSGGDQTVHGAVRHQSLPRNEALGVGVFESYVDNDARNRTSNCRSQPLVEHFQQYRSDIGVAGSGSLLPTRAATEERSSQQIGAGYRQLVLGAQICNSSNHCYANSLVKCVLWLCEDTTELQAMLGQLLFDGIRPALTGSPHHLWQNGSWQEAMTGWAMPHSQHDVGEFLRYFVQQSGGLKFALELSWEARLLNGGADDDALRRDVTNSEVLVIDPYLADATHRGDSVMLQQLIHAWENQAYIHALTERPLILAILIGRFSNDGGHIRKYHGKIIPNVFLEIPVFDTDGFHAKRYELNSFVAHSGSTPFAGHYTAVFRHGSTYLKADDGLVAQPLNDVQFQQMCSQGYLFFYQSV